MTTERYDVIVVGAGHNGLICAARLAKAGKSVLVLEANASVGGMAVTQEFTDGFSVSGCAQFLGELNDVIAKDLGISRIDGSGALETVVLSPSGEHVRYSGETVTGVSAEERARYQRFRRRMDRFAALLGTHDLLIPPRLGTRRARDWLPLLRSALRLRRLGREDLREFLRVIAMNIRDEVVEQFESPLLRGGISFDAVLGTNMGPRSPGTVLTYLHRLGSGSPTQPVGGMGAFSTALAARAEQLGVTILTDHPVRRVCVTNGRVSGVACESGQQFESLTVVSNLDPKRTVADLVGARHFETRFVHRIRHLRSAGNVAKLHLALSRLPSAPGLKPEELGKRLLVAIDEAAIEAAFNPSKYGEFSPQPALEFTVPTVHDTSLAPAAQHVLSANVIYAPYALRGGWSNDHREQFAQAAIDQLASVLPDIDGCIRAIELLTPTDIEDRFGATGGHWHHADLALDQFLFVRPVAGAAQYQLPLDGLFLCGAGMHPGGGVVGAAGYNAAAAVLRREKITWS